MALDPVVAQRELPARRAARQVDVYLAVEGAVAAGIRGGEVGVGEGGIVERARVPRVFDAPVARVGDARDLGEVRGAVGAHEGGGEYGCHKGGQTGEVAHFCGGGDDFFGVGCDGFLDMAGFVAQEFKRCLKSGGEDRDLHYSRRVRPVSLVAFL